MLDADVRTKFFGYVNAGTVLRNYAHIFELLMRMRQSACHPWLITHKQSSGNEIDICGICHEEAEDAIMSECKHVFCREDAKLYISSNCASATACPVCFRPLSIDLLQPAIDSKYVPRCVAVEDWLTQARVQARPGGAQEAQHCEPAGH